MKYIFDFDDVLFNNTAQFKEHMFKLLAQNGVPEDKARARYLKLREKEFSLRSFLIDFRVQGLYEEIMRECPHFLNSDLIEAVRRIGPENCYIITYGDREFQKDKIKYSGLTDFFPEGNIHYVKDNKEKITEIESIRNLNTENQGAEFVFIDNDKKNVNDVQKENLPHLTVFHYRDQDFKTIAEKLAKDPGNKIRRN